MKIDIERLEVDPSYWYSLGVPGDAQEHGPSNGYFYKKENNVWYYWRSDLNEPWQECSAGEPLVGGRIQRPTKDNVSVEWDGKGWPEVGTECEVKVEEWEHCRVIGFDKPFMCVARDGSGYYAAMQEELRPIRTREDRQREELFRIAEGILHGHSGVQFSDEIAAAILSRYNLESKS